MTTLEKIYNELAERFKDEPNKNMILGYTMGVLEKNKFDCLYAFLYNSCIYESSWATISLHYSKEGAEKAMQEHEQKALDEFNEIYNDDGYDFGFKFGEHEDWRVEEINILP